MIFFLTSENTTTFKYAVSRIWFIAVFCKDVTKMAFDLNATIGPIIDGVVLLMPSFLALIIAVVPIIITMSVVGFIIKFWDQIVRMMNF